MHPTETSKPQHRIDGARRRLASKQTSQIVENLSTRKQLIDQQEAEFRLRVWNWESAAASQQASLDQRKSELDVKEQRLRELQFQMLELQNQIIESQLSLESIVTQVAQPATPDEPIVGLEALRHELFDRFDFVEERWTQMINDLRLVAQQVTQAMKKPEMIELD